MKGSQQKLSEAGLGDFPREEKLGGTELWGGGHLGYKRCNRKVGTEGVGPNASSQTKGENLLRVSKRTLGSYSTLLPRGGE